MSPRESCVLESAMPLPIFKRLQGKRVVLASASPRRQEILLKVGFKPEIIPSTFEENLPKESYSSRWADYPIATAGEKALEVYERLMREDDRNPADLVISGDTVVIFPPEADAHASHGSGIISKILEKPLDKHEQLRSLQDMNGKYCEVVTGVTIVYPTVEAPGFKLQSISSSTLVKFNENSDELLKAYVESGEGHDRAGGFAAQGLGGLLVEGIEGDQNNVAGFPLSQFWRWMSDLEEDGVFNDM